MKLAILTQTIDENNPLLGFFCRWVAEFSRYAGRVTVIANTAGAHRFPEHVTVHSLGKERGLPRYKRYARFMIFLFRALTESDGIFVHMIPEFVIAAAPILFFKKRPVFFWYAHGAVSWRLRLAVRLSTIVFTSSASGFRMHSPKRRIVGQGIDTEFFCPLALSSKNSLTRLISVGRISPSKQYEVMLRAILFIRNRYHDVAPHLTIIGNPGVPNDYAYAQSLQTFVRCEGLDDAVEFKPAVVPHALAAELSKARIFVNASNTGSLDKAVLEAMSSGMMVLTSNEAYRMILPERYRFCDGDSEELGRKIVVLKDGGRDPSLREIVIQNHGVERLVGLMARIMREVLGSPAAAQ